MYVRDTSSVTATKAIHNNLEEIGRHVQDRNDASKLAPGRSIVIHVFIHKYLREHSNDFEAIKNDEDGRFLYSGETDADGIDLRRWVPCES
jgi:hypothetical protein